MNNYYIGIQGSYKHLEISFFEHTTRIAHILEDDVRASSHLISYLDFMLKEHGVTVNELAFIAVDHGPGAFTSLRVTLATLNGISFAQKTPLMGINGLESLAYETYAHRQTSFDPATRIICLLNAYNNDVYVADYKIIDNKHLELVKPIYYANIDTVLSEYSSSALGHPLLFTGNAALLYREKIKTCSQAILTDPIIICGSATTIAERGYKLWQAGVAPATHIDPLYVKIQQFAPKFS